MDSEALAQLWRTVELSPAEERVIAAVRLVEPRVRRIAVRSISEGGAKVLLDGKDAPVPLGTLGEGVARLLSIALNLAVAEGGYLCIDEIENGVHWTVIPKLWRFLVESGRELNVQVFATTHSKDCIEALAQLQQEHPELAARVSVHRLDRGRSTATRFDAARIDEYVAMELDPR